MAGSSRNISHSSCVAEFKIMKTHPSIVKDGLTLKPEIPDIINVVRTYCFRLDPLIHRGKTVEPRPRAADQQGPLRGKRSPAVLKYLPKQERGYLGT